MGDAATELEALGGVTALVSSPESNIVASKLNDKTQDRVVTRYCLLGRPSKKKNRKQALLTNEVQRFADALTCQPAPAPRTYISRMVVAHSRRLPR